MELRLNHVRISFADGLWTAKAYEEGNTPKFGADFILDETSRVEKQVNGKWVPTTLPEAELEVATEAHKGDKAKAKAWIDRLDRTRQTGVRNGNDRVSKAGDIYEGYEDRTYVSAKNKSRPTAYNRDGSPLTEEEGVIYSGCYVDVRVSMFAITDPKRKGVFTGLGGVKFAGDADSFSGGRAAAADEFADATEGTGADDFS